MNEILIPVITAVVGGTITWIIKDSVEFFKNKKLSKFNYKQFSGKWNSIHLTKDNEYKISRHRYELMVSNTGVINGKLIELSTNPEWEYKVKGKILPGGWILQSMSKTRIDEFAIEVYFNDLNQNKILGFLISYDLDRNPFCSFTILSREEVTEEVFIKELTKYSKNFYLKP